MPPTRHDTSGQLKLFIDRLKRIGVETDLRKNPQDVVRRIRLR